MPALGPDGWDGYDGETPCLAIDAESLELPMLGSVDSASWGDGRGGHLFEWFG